MGLKAFVVVFSALLAIARTAGVHSKGFQAVAHLWVGLLFGVAFGIEIMLALLPMFVGDTVVKEIEKETRAIFLACFCSGIAISVVELICFLRTLFGGHT